jgi:predicted phage terminase large subunit-like protein
VGTAATGYRANVIIIDDPIKGVEAAQSEADRERVADWYFNDIVTRRTPDCGVVLVMTRWHEDDLAGRLLRLEGPDWRQVRLTAIAEEDDPLYRAKGTPLWDDQPEYGYASDIIRQRAAYERNGQSAIWYSLFQGSPRPPEGALFKTGRMPVFDFVPGEVIQTVRAYDFASSTSASADYTVALKLALVRRTNTMDNDIWVIMDLTRGRDAPEDVERGVKMIAQMDGYNVPIYLPEDPGQAGQSQVNAFTRMLAGYPVTPVRMTGSKELRAMAVAAQANQGRVGMLRAPWNAVLLEELAAFPRGRHDDQVDALSLAFDQIASHPPMRIDPWELVKLGARVPSELLQGRPRHD